LNAQILFVDDVQDILRGLKRMLHSKRKEWDVHFALGGQAALDFLEDHNVNIVVSDMRMPGMDGTQLLAKVKELYPDTIRFILSGHSEWEKISEAMSSMHQFLSKPCNADELISSLSNALRAQKMLASSQLREVVTNMQAVPCMPSIYNELIKELKNDDVSFNRVEEIISKDSGMVTKVLQLVNSAFYGIVQEVTNIPQSISILGLDTIKSLALTLNVFQQLNVSKENDLFISSLWNHGIKTAEYSKVIAKCESQDKSTVDNAFLSGLLHDSGKLILLNNLPEEYARAIKLSKDKCIPLYIAEKEIFGVTHSEIAAFVFNLWGLPASTIKAILYHHAPMELMENEFGVLTALHSANALSYEVDDYAAEYHPIDTEYLESLGLSDRLPTWKNACQDLSVARR